MPQQTKEQQIASNPNHSVWVTASAGTGKTKILTDRVLRLLLEGVEPNKILCLTFTNAAAAEMAQRINNELSKWVAIEDQELQSIIKDLINKSPSEKIMILARQLFTIIIDNPDELKIQTIHAFCQSLLKRFPLEAGLPPHFTIVDEQVANELVSEAWNNMLMSPDTDEIIKDALKDIVCEISDHSLTEIISGVMMQRNKIQRLFDQYESKESLIDKVYTSLSIQTGTTASTIIEQEYSDNEINRERLQYLCEALNTGTQPCIDRAVTISEWLIATVDKRVDMFESYRSVFLTSKIEEKQVKSIITKQPLENYPESTDTIGLEQKKLLRITDRINSLKVAKLTEGLIHICFGIFVHYKELKQASSYLDYNDLIFEATKLLSDSDSATWIMYKLDNGIDHILVDEAQDTSPEQWRIIHALCEEFFAGGAEANKKRTVFVVGDEKQSIYSFQGADPDVFALMRIAFSEMIENAKSGWQSVSLDLSFRSTEPILRAVDTVFFKEEYRQAITAIAPEIEHKSFRSEAPGIVEVWPLCSIHYEKKEDEVWPIPKARVTRKDTKLVLASNIALTIKNWLSAGRILQGKSRPLTAGDIMILVRSRTDFMESMVRALEQHGVPVAGSDRMVLTEHIAIMDLITLADFLLLPSDDLSLATILKSPLMGVSEDELFELAYNRKNKTLWQQVQQNDKKSFDYLSDLMIQINCLTPFEFFSYVLDAKEGRKAFVARLGQEAKDPIDEFINLTITYNYNHTSSMQKFLRWIKAGKAEIKRDLEQGKDVVRIMTVHGSKGLQAPVVFLPDTTRAPRSSNSLLWSNENDFFLWPGKKSNYNNICKDIDNSDAREQHDEYLRLLYVAMTRAEDELYITGWRGKDNPADNCWYNIVKDGLRDSAEKDFLNFEGIDTEDNELLRFSSQNIQLNLVPDAEKPEIKEIAPVPDYLYQQAPVEPSPAIPLAPSRPDENEPNALSPLSYLEKKHFERGNTSHLLLQILPEIEVDNREEIASNIIEGHASSFHAEDKKQLVAEVLSVINNPAFSELFSKNSKAEVPVTGKIGKNIVSGQVDRLVVTDKEVLIIDYKTNRAPPKTAEETPNIYRKQMAVYKQVLELIYPDKNIRCFLLWTSELKLFEI